MQGMQAAGGMCTHRKTPKRSTGVSCTAGGGRGDYRDPLRGTHFVTHNPHSLLPNCFLSTHNQHSLTDPVIIVFLPNQSKTCICRLHSLSFNGRSFVALSVARMESFIWIPARLFGNFCLNFREIIALYSGNICLDFRRPHFNAISQSVQLVLSARKKDLVIF